MCRGSANKMDLVAQVLKSINLCILITVKVNLHLVREVGGGGGGGGLVCDVSLHSDIFVSLILMHSDLDTMIYKL